MSMHEASTTIEARLEGSDKEMQRRDTYMNTTHKWHAMHCTVDPHSECSHLILVNLFLHGG